MLAIDKPHSIFKGGKQYNKSNESRINITFQEEEERMNVQESGTFCNKR